MVSSRFSRPGFLSLAFVFSLTSTSLTHAALLELVPTSRSVQIGEVVRVDAKVGDAGDLFGAPFYVSFPANLIDVLEVTEGTFLKSDGKPTSFLYKVNEGRGEVVIGLSRMGRVGGVGGSGLLLSLHIRGRKAGVVDLSFRNVDFRDSDLRPIPVRLRGTKITITKR